MELFDYARVRQEVHDFCQLTDYNTFDEAGIVTELLDLAYDRGHRIRSIDDVDPDIFNEIVEDHDNGTVNWRRKREVCKNL